MDLANRNSLKGTDAPTRTMAEQVDRLSLLFDPEDVRRVPEGFGHTLAGHLVGREVSRGDRIALPGWPVATVETAEPAGEVVPGTEITIHVPPRPTEGAMSLVVLVDASLTMGKGDPSPFERASRVIDGVLLNGRAFLQAAGIVIQGGTTRQVDPLKGPEELSGPSILKVDPKGTFDLDAGIERALELLEDAPDGPRAVLLVTDGDDPPTSPLDRARPLLHAGVTLFTLTDEAVEPFDEVCSVTGGRAMDDPSGVFEAVAELAGSQATFRMPEAPEPSIDEDYEFEVVIETMEEA